MTAIAHPFGSAQGKYKFLGTASLVNCYSELQGDQGKSRVVIVPGEGLTEFVDEADTPPRGFIYLEDLDCIYEVRSSSVWKTTYPASVATSVRIGTLPGVDNVQITRNKASPPQITIRCNAGLYYIESDVIKLLNDADLPADIISVETLGEFTLFGNEDGRIFFSTQSDTSQVDALDFFTAEQSADKLVRLIVNRGELFAGGQFTIEAFAFRGDINAPFEFRTLIPYGVLSGDSVAECDGTIMWVGATKSGEKAAYRLEGYNAKKISNAEVDRLIASDANQSAILGFSIGVPGHSFYVVTGTNWTRVYDASTGEWHARKSRGLDIWRVKFAVSAWGMVRCGDRESGKTLTLDGSTFTEDGGIMSFEVITPHMHLFPNGGRVNSIDLDFLAGHGVTVASAQGFDPYAMVSKSVDGGNTFGAERNLHLGRQGDYGKQIKSWRWGRFGGKGCVWKIVVTDPVPRSLARLDADVTPLKQ